MCYKDAAFAMSRRLDWQRAAVTQRLRAEAGADATARRYTGALSTRRDVATLIARRNLSQRTACLCPDRRRPHEATAPCPHLLPRRPLPRRP